MSQKRGYISSPTHKNRKRRKKWTSGHYLFALKLFKSTRVGRLSIVLTVMDVTCGISLNPSSSTFVEFEEALLAENYENIEKYSKKMRKKREVSQGNQLFVYFYLNFNTLPM